MMISSEVLLHIAKEIQNEKRECNKYLDQYLCRKRTPKSPWKIGKMNNDNQH